MAGINIMPGDYIHVIDADLEIDRLIRVLSIEKSIYEPVKTLDGGRKDQRDAIDRNNAVYLERCASWTSV